jgi:ribosomal protein L40E
MPQQLMLFERLTTPAPVCRYCDARVPVGAGECRVCAQWKRADVIAHPALCAVATVQVRHEATPGSSRWRW